MVVFFQVINFFDKLPCICEKQYAFEMPHQILDGDVIRNPFKCVICNSKKEKKWCWAIWNACIIMCLVQNKEKAYFTSLNYHKSLIFIPQLQNRVSCLPQLSKPFVLPPLTISLAVFAFFFIVFSFLSLCSLN